MNKSTKNEIVSNIRDLEDNSTSLSPVDAEKLMGDILKPLLLEDNFKIIQATRARDVGVDFTAIKEETETTSKTTIGIEYKHYKSSVSSSDVYKLIGAASVNSFNRAILATNSKFTIEAKKVAMMVEPIVIELIDIDRLKEWVSNIEIENDINKLEIEEILKVVSHRFAYLVAKDPDNLYKIEWRDLERMIAEVFEGIGFKVELTPSSKDGGKDIVLSCNVLGKSKSYIIEIKHWRSGIRVGQSAVRDFLNVIIQERRDSGLYLSTFGYCNNAFESISEIEKQKICFGEKEKIVSLCKTYTRMASGIWSPTQNLSEILFENAI